MDILSRVPSCCWLAMAIEFAAIAIFIILVSGGSDEDDMMGRG
jgi:hypothetical protein